jgi:hypothetical protein
MSACVLLIRALGGGWRVTRADGSLVRSDESPSLEGPTG